MTREHATDKDNPATDPQSENGQGKHDGIAHTPDEFDALNPAKLPEADKPVVPGGRKPDTAMCENRNQPGMIDKNEDC